MRLAFYILFLNRILDIPIKAYNFHTINVTN